MEIQDKIKELEIKAKELDSIKQEIEYYKSLQQPTDKDLFMNTHRYIKVELSENNGVKVAKFNFKKDCYISERQYNDIIINNIMYTYEVKKDNILFKRDI